MLALKTGYYNQPYLVCPDCDLVVKPKPLTVGKKLVCPRCQYVLVVARKNPINRGLALSLSALILAVPANLLPIMTFSKLGIDSADTLVRNVIALIDQGFLGMALLVFFCSMLAPVLESLLICVICLMVKRQLLGRPLVMALITHSRVRRWAMLEVYLLGILVAYVKMIGSGQIYFGLGMVCFVGMFLMATLNTLLFDSRMVWEMVGRQLEHSMHHR